MIFKNFFLDPILNEFVYSSAKCFAFIKPFFSIVSWSCETLSCSFNILLSKVFPPEKLEKYFLKYNGYKVS